MTRGRILYIYNGFQVCTTCEFNGDMHPQRYGEDVLSGFQNGLFQNYGGYERFVDIINRLQEAADLQEQVDRLVRNSRENIESDFCNAVALQISHESSVVFLLKRIMHDQYEYIDYFIYELDYGRKYEPGMITDENGQDIDIHTPKLLYDFISNNGVMCQKEVCSYGS